MIAERKAAARRDVDLWAAGTIPMSEDMVDVEQPEQRRASGEARAREGALERAHRGEVCRPHATAQRQYGVEVEVATKGDKRLAACGSDRGHRRCLLQPHSRVEHVEVE